LSQCGGSEGMSRWWRQTQTSRTDTTTTEINENRWRTDQNREYNYTRWM